MMAIESRSFATRAFRALAQDDKLAALSLSRPNYPANSAAKVVSAVSFSAISFRATPLSF